MRIQKYLSEQKILSRREAEEYIRLGLIKLNGKIVTEMGIQIDPEKDQIEILPVPPNLTEEKMTIAFNKPRGVVCSREKSEGQTIFDLLPQFEHLNAVGRLDKQSEGLILLSNDGTVTNAVTGDKHTTEKEYQVWVREDIMPAKLEKMSEGILLEDGMTLPAKTEKTGSHSYTIILKEGRKHQIRRMADAIQLTITNLKRTRIGNIKLNDLQKGEYRVLLKDETDTLKKMSL